MKSWKTTIAGLLGIVGANLALFFPEYAKLGGFLAAVASGAGLMFARDNNITSEQALAGSAKPPGPRDDKRQQKFFSMLIAAGCAVGLLSGCNSLKATYTASATTHVTAKAALSAWNDYLAVNEVSEATEIKVRAAWRKYQSAQLTLLDAAVVVATATEPDASDEERLEKATAAASEALASVVKLLREIGVKL